MAETPAIKPTHKAIQQYYKTLQEFQGRQVAHESALRTAFQHMLSETGKAYGWMLVPEQRGKFGGKTVIPDGTLRDAYNLPRGYWEAKDTDDDLPAEVSRKIAKGYPLTNTIFEDTRRAILFQNGQERRRVDLQDSSQLADLLNGFFSFAQPDIEGFEKAVKEFKEHVPELARGLASKIQTAHQDNRKFIAAYNDFFSLCQTSLNPNIRSEAVDEMLVQHLLTERLIRKIFDNPEFTHRNVIAAEVETVISALVSKSFNRDAFLKSLDRFYRAIEDAARGLEEFTDKQHFLNTVYERFFQGYSVKVADTHGIVYTPQPIVDFMCASIAEVLETEFGKSLGDRGVHILDPCTGTGNFIVNLMRRIPKKDLPRMYREQLFANEVMLLPYYIAALNIEHAYYELTGEYEPFEGLCFVDTLDLAEGEQGMLGFMNEANTARVDRQKKTHITVVVGNPPYNVGQLNENDNNKNRKYKVVDERINRTYVKDSKATLNTKLYDAYVKFFRWASDRLGKRDGIVCFVSNNSFVDQIAFDGMRKHLLQDFTLLYHINLHGNVRQNPKLSGTTHNVFGIQVGVGITVAVRKAQQKGSRLFYYRVPEDSRKEEKLDWLDKTRKITGVEWQPLAPDDGHTWLRPDHAAAFSAFLPIGTREAKLAEKWVEESVFKTFSLGVNTARDNVLYDFCQQSLSRTVEEFSEAYNSEIDRYKRKGAKHNLLDDFLDYSRIKWSENLKRSLLSGHYLEFNADRIRDALYRPFTQKRLYFSEVAIDRRGRLPRFFPTRETEEQNRAISLTTLGSEKPFMTLMVAGISDLHLVGAGSGSQCFPFYTYHEDGSNQRENITDWALERFREHYQDRSISKWDIFYYVYGLLHHPGYREKFVDCLKRELPRIPLAPDFKAFATAGKELARLHLDYEKLKPYPLKFVTTDGIPLSYRVEDKMRLNKEKTALKVNPSLTLSGIPREAFQYRLGNRSALEWVIDQYQVSEDPRSGIRSDPNRVDDPEYIVRLVGQVIRVSLETVGIVATLPASYGS